MSVKDSNLVIKSVLGLNCFGLLGQKPAETEGCLYKRIHQDRGAILTQQSEGRVREIYMSLALEVLEAGNFSEN